MTMVICRHIGFEEEGRMGQGRKGRGDGGGGCTSKPQTRSDTT